MPEKTPVLLTHPLLQLVNTLVRPAHAELAFFTSELVVKNVVAGELIVREKDICREVYFVEKGLLRTYLNVEEKQVNTEFFFEGEFAAAFTSLSLGRSTSLQIEAIEDARLLVIPKNLLEKMYRLHPAWLALGNPGPHPFR